MNVIKYYTCNEGNWFCCEVMTDKGVFDLTLHCNGYWFQFQLKEHCHLGGEFEEVLEELEDEVEFLLALKVGTPNSANIQFRN